MVYMLREIASIADMIFHVKMNNTCILNTSLPRLCCLAVVISRRLEKMLNGQKEAADRLNIYVFLILDISVALQIHGTSLKPPPTILTFGCCTR